MLSREDIKKELRKLLSEVGAVENHENDEYSLVKEMDSIQMISLIVEIEEHFGIEIPDEYLVTEFFENEEHVIDVIEQLILETSG